MFHFDYSLFACHLFDLITFFTRIYSRKHQNQCVSCVWDILERLLLLLGFEYDILSLLQQMYSKQTHTHTHTYQYIHRNRNKCIYIYILQNMKDEDCTNAKMQSCFIQVASRISCLKYIFCTHTHTHTQTDILSNRYQGVHGAAHTHTHTHRHTCMHKENNEFMQARMSILLKLYTQSVIGVCMCVQCTRIVSFSKNTHTHTYIYVRNMKHNCYHVH